MELIIGFIMCGVVMVGVHLYLRYFATEGARHRPFERWCHTRPLVIAIRCQPGTTIDAYELLRQQLEPHAFFSNSQGRYPWQHYAVQVEARRLDGDVILVFVTRCRQPKARERLPDLARALEAFGRDAGSRLEEIWLHGQLHAVNRRTGIDREQLAWLGSFEESGSLQLSAMIGQPPWLTETLNSAA